MKLSSFIKDKLFYIVMYLLSFSIIMALLFVINANYVISIFVVIIMLLNLLVPLIYEYYKKKAFYNNINDILLKLDQKYLITEMVADSNFIEGKLLLDYLYDIDKSMHEHVNLYVENNKEFKDYIEMWCHEIKTPIATANLLIENAQKNATLQSINEEMQRIENYVEQVLYYARSDTVSKDYFVTDTSLIRIVNSVIKKNKKDLLAKKIKIMIDDLDSVKSDPKWLEFVLNQIISNSIKYAKDQNAYIHIYSKNNKNSIVFYLEDNGVGIKTDELDRVFDKGFTGTNGRIKQSSTGMGLYLCKKLCDKLGHSIGIESKVNSYTIVSITFPCNSYTQELK